MSLSGNVTLKAMWNKIKKDYIHNLDMVRDAFFGGRMEAFKMYEEASQTQKIKYYDVTSLCKQDWQNLHWTPSHYYRKLQQHRSV